MERIFFTCTLIYLCVSCGHSSKTIENNPSMSTSRDARQIENTFISIVESFRKTIAANDSSGTNSSEEIDPANFFSPYAIRLNHQTLEYEASHFITSKEITVNVDTIVYSKDSLLCVALIGIEDHYANLYIKQKNMYPYDGRAVIGCRDSIDSPFQIYPFLKFAIIGYGSLNEVFKDLRYYYFIDIVGDGGPTGTNLEGYIYTNGLGNPNFFIDAPNFKRNEYGEYKFKYYLDGDKEVPYNYYK